MRFILTASRWFLGTERRASRACAAGPRYARNLVIYGPLLLLWALPAPSNAADPDPARERQKLAGVWKGFTVEGKGENPDRGPVKLELRVGERIHGLEFKGANVVDHGEGEFSLDLTRTPAVLDAWKTNERGRRQSYLGIYTLEGDTLKWCVSPQKTRPATFETAKGQFLLILKRQPTPAAAP